MVQPRNSCKKDEQARTRDSVFAEAARKAAALTLASTLGAFCASGAAVASTGEQRNEAFGGQALESADAGNSADSVDTDSVSLPEVSDSFENPAPSEPESDVATGDSESDADVADAGAAADLASPAADLEAFALASEADPDAAAIDATADGASPEAQAATLYDRIQAKLAASTSAVVDVEEGDSLTSQVVIPEGKQLTLNLNGCSLSASAAGAAFQLSGGSTLTIIDNSAAKTGSLSTGSALATQGADGKCNLNLQSGHVSCSTLVSSASMMQVTLSGGSVSMTSTMNVTDSLWVEVRGGCSVSSSASGGAFQISGGGSVSVLGNARVTYSGSGAAFVLKSAGVLEMGSGASCGVAISAANGSIVQFDSKSVDASYNGASISCGSGHPVFQAGSGGAGATIKFVSGVLPDDSLKNFLASGSFCVHEPGKGFVVRNQAFVNDSCIGVADDVYYYSEEDFANATGNKVHFVLVEFSFDPATCAGTSVVGKTGHIHVAPGTELRNAPLFELMKAPAREGYEFWWVRASTDAKLTPDEVLALPIAAGGAYSFVGTYAAEQVEPPDPGPGPDEPDPGSVDPPDPGPGPDEPDPPGPVDPPDPGPVGPVGPVDPGAGGSGSGAGGNGGGSGAGEGGASGVGGTASPGRGSGYGAVTAMPGSRGPLEPHAPETPWNPPGLALAAGFTVPASGPGVLVRELMSAPGGTPAAGAGDGGGSDGSGRDGASPWDALGAGARTFFDTQGPAGVDLPLSAAEVALLAGLGAATALAALIASRRSAFLAANAAAQTANATA